MMTPLRICGLGFLLLAAGCAGFGEPPAGPAPAASQGEAVSAAPPEAVAPRKKAAATQTDAGNTPVPAVAPAPSSSRPDAVAARPEAPAAKSEAPAAPKNAIPADTSSKTDSNKKAEVTVAPVAKPAAPPAPKTAPAPAAKPATLDLTALEKRLKETNAIGVFTKLTLKNQVDELLDRFRGYYDGRVKLTLAQLRQPYDLLILKVLSLLQDGDPSLARAVAESREAIWGILSDPNKFKKL